MRKYWQQWAFVALFTALSPAKSFAADVVFSLDDMTFPANQSAEVVLNMSNETGDGMVGYEFRMLFDSTKLLFEGATPSPQVSGWTVTVVPQGGMLAVIAFGTPLTGTTELARFRFTNLTFADQPLCSTGIEVEEVSAGASLGDFDVCVVTPCAPNQCTDQTLTLSPATASRQVGETHTINATWLDAGVPQAGISIDFEVTSGPHAGTTSTAITDASGVATFAYNGTDGGTDTIRATAPIQNGVVAPIFSQFVTCVWQLPTQTLTLGPASATRTVGDAHLMTATLISDGQPLVGKTVTFTVTSGPHVNETLTTTTDGAGQATFTLGGTASGTDQIEVTAPVQPDVFQPLTSTGVTVTWVMPVQTLDLSPDNSTNAVQNTETFVATFVSDGLPIAGVDIDFEILTGPHAGQTGSGVTDGNGQARWTFQGTLPGTDGVRAVAPVQGTTVPATVISDTVTSLWIDQQSLVLAPDTATLRPGETHQMTATLRQDGVAVEGATVRFTVIAGPHIGTTKSAVTDVSGIATISYSGTLEGTDFVQADAQAQPGVPSAVQSNTATVIWQIDRELVLTPPSESLIVGDTHLVRVTYTENGLPRSGVSVDFRILDGPHAPMAASGITDASGNTSFSYVGTAAGTDEIRAEVPVQSGVPAPVLSDVVTADWRLPNQVLTLAPDAASVTIGDSHTMTATFASEGQPVANATVLFEVISGPHTGYSETQTTDGSGQATFVQGGTSAGIDQIRATAMQQPGVPVDVMSNVVEVTWIMPVQMLDLAPATSINMIPSTQVFTATFTSDGVPRAGVSINLEFLAGPHPAGFLTAVTDANGVATFPFQGSAPGTDQIRAVAPVQGASVPAFVTSNTVTSLWILNQSLTLSPAIATQKPGDPHSVSATLLQDGVPVVGATVSFTVLSGPNATATGSGVTDASGIAAYTYTGQGEGTDEIVAEALVQPGVPADVSSEAVNVVWVFGRAVTLAPPSATRTVGESHTVTATYTKDGVPQAGVSVEFTVTGPHAQGPASATTDASGNATFSYAGNGAGTDQIRAEVPVQADVPSAVQSDFATVDWRMPDQQISLAPPSATRTVGESHTVTATYTKDGVPLAGVTMEFTILTGPHAGTPTSATTDGSGSATFTYVGDGAGTDQIRADVAAQANVPEPVQSDLATVDWRLPVQEITLAPDTATLKIGETHTVRATLTTDGQPLGGIVVDFEVFVGPHAGTTLSTTTDSLGQCTFDVMGTSAGTDEIHATVAPQTGVPVGLTSNPVEVTWRAPAQVIVLGPDTGKNLVSLTETLTATFTSDGVPQAGITINLQVVSGPHQGIRDTQTTDENGVVTLSYQGSAAGTDQIRAVAPIQGMAVPITVVSNEVTRTWFLNQTLVLEPQSATQDVGRQHGVSATLAQDGVPVAGASVEFTVISGAHAGTTDSATTDASGVATFSYAGTQEGTDTIRAEAAVQPGVPEAETSDNVSVTWNSVRVLALAPASVERTVGDPHLVTATYTKDGVPQQGITIDFEVLPGGPHAGQTGAATTDASGHALFLYSSSSGGIDSIRAVAAVQPDVPAAVESDTVSVTWISPNTEVDIVRAIEPVANITTLEPCTTIQFELLRNTTGDALGIDVTLALDGLQLCGDPATSIRAGSWLDGFSASPLFTIVKGDSIRISHAILVGCGTSTGGTLFEIDVTAASIEVTSGTVRVAKVDLRDCDNADLGALGGPLTTVNVSVEPPSAIGNLTASPVKSGNGNGGTIGVQLDFETPPAGTTVEVYRSRYGNYPEYDDTVERRTERSERRAPNALASDALVSPSYPPAQDEWTLTDVTEPGGIDHFGERDCWYYVAFVKDVFGNVSEASAVTPGTLNYHLGDWVDAQTICGGDNAVDILDVSLLTNHYGSILGYSDPLNCLDIGPTRDGSVNSLPVTDNRIDFEDLILMAINFANVSKPPTLPEAASSDEISISAPHRASRGSDIVVPVRIQGTGAVQGLSLELSWNAAIVRPVDVEAGELLQQQGGVALSAKPGAIDVALMGSNGPGLTGRGTLVEVHFEVLSDGDPAIMIASAEARDKTNEGIEIGIGVTDRVAVPHTTRLLASVPNPFNATTTVQFELASREHVELAVYDVNGRLVRQLVAEMRGPGRYQVVWHGMDDRGRGVASGVYFVRLRAGDVMRKRALTVVK